MTAALMSASPPARAEGVTIVHAQQTSATSGDEFQLRDNADPTGLEQILADPGNLTLLWIAQTALRDGQIELGKQNVEHKHQAVESLFATIREAIREAEKAAKNKGLFGELCDKFGVAGQVAVAVVAIASVVSTGGASLIAIAALAGTLLSMGAKPLAEVLGGGETLENVFRYTGMGLSVLAGGVGFLQSVGIVGTQATAQASAVLKEVCRAVTMVGSGVQAGATAAQGVTGCVRDSYASDELDALADEQDARTTRAGQLEDIELLVEFLKQVDKSFSASRATLTETMNLQAESDWILVNLGVRA